MLRESVNCEYLGSTAPQEEEVQAAVEQQRSSGGLRIEITPQYIVFDTNCYIRYDRCC
jgi:hypothetical protein